MKICLVLLLIFDLSAKVRLLTFHYNKPEFIELQYKAFTKFLEDDFEIIVFNDANTPEREEAIRKTCETYGIQCIRFEPEWHLHDPLNTYLKKQLDNPQIKSHVLLGKDIASIAENYSVRHCHVIQYALDHYGYSHDDVVAIVDGDLFPIRPISIKEMLSDCDIAAIHRDIWVDRVAYLWVVFIAFNPQSLPDLEEFQCHLDVINNTIYDSGAHTYHYLKNHPNVRAKRYIHDASTEIIHHTQSCLEEMGYLPDEAWLIKYLPWPCYVEFHLDKHFLHFAGSSFYLEGRDLKEAYLKTFLAKILEKHP